MKKKRVRFISGPDPDIPKLSCVNSPALRIPTIQTRSAPVHDDERLRAALVAEGSAGREAGAVAGD